MKNGIKKNGKAVGATSKTPDLRAQIETRAYALWLADGCREGNDVNHWLQAEQELRTAQQRISTD